jgi:hypothetical protein
MKTTLDLSDGVLERAKEHAVHEGRTLRAIVEDALRLYLDSVESSARPRQGLAIHPWGSGGLQPQYRDKSWTEILDAVNERPLPDEPAG